MKQEEFPILFRPAGRTVFVLAGTSLLEAAARSDIVLQTPCGGAGHCGKCRVHIADGYGNLADGRTGYESRRAPKPGAVLACVARANGPMTVDVPAESLFETRQQILTGDSGLRGALDPHVRQCRFQLPPPSAQDTRSDARRLADGIEGLATMVPACRRALPAFLRRHAWQGAATLRGDTLVALDPPETTKAAHGVALDIGTTTVVATLIGLLDGREVGVASALNGQTAMGDDVIARIRRVREDPDELRALSAAVRDTVNGLIHELTMQAGMETQSVLDVTVVGNTAMQQLLCGYDPSALGELPFVPAFERGHALPARELGLDTHPEADVFVFPQIGGFVGGDTVAAMLAARLDQSPAPTLLVDIGTNGEIVLAAEGKLLATSVAAGPAFEGARIAQGMRAAPGAIEKIVLADDIRVNVIGNVTPTGLCGSALVDAAAAMLDMGMMDETGRILAADELPAALPTALRSRLREADGQPCLVLTDRDEYGPDAPAVLLRQKDIRELQLATAAVRAGIAILLRRAELNAADLDSILLAGGFGNFIRRNHAQRIGLLPAVPSERIRFLGNAASLGAKLALLSVEERRYADRLRDRAEHVDLSLDPEFQNEFGAAMIFPEP